MDHPAVAQVVTFAMPTTSWARRSLRCGAARREGSGRAGCGLRRGAAGRLQGAAKGRLPGGTPQGATGKLKRIGLAESWAGRADLHLRRRRHRRLAGGAAGQGGAEVTVVARGPHLAAMRERLTPARRRETGAPSGRRLRRAEGPQDDVSSRQGALVPAAADDAAAAGAETALIPGINGIPTGTSTGSRGPAGASTSERRPGDGCGTASLRARHRLRRLSGGRGGGARRLRAHGRRPLHPGQPRQAGRLPRRSALLAGPDRRGLKAPVRPKIRDQIWIELWGNLSFDPMSALTLRRWTSSLPIPGTVVGRARHDAGGEAVGEKLEARFWIVCQ